MFIFRPWKIGKVMGIPISVDPSWLIIFALLTFELGTGLFPSELRLGRRFGFGLQFNSEALLLGMIASLLLFGSVLAHELSHAWMALKRGIPVLGITLFIFGGVAQIGDEADSPATEFLVAIMGPLMSLALAVVFGAIWVWSGALLSLAPATSGLTRPVVVAGSYLSQANALLVLFNLLPGFPLDGGRVFRAFMWALLGNLRQATLVAMVVGRGIAVLMAAGGAVLLFGLGVSFGGFEFHPAQNLGGVWFILIAAFLWQVSGEAYRSVVTRDSLKLVPVSRLMHAPVENVSGSLNLANFAEEFMMRPRALAFAVVENSQPVGVIGGEQIRKIPRSIWSSASVRDVMMPLSPNGAVALHDNGLQAMQKLARLDGDDAEVVVVSEGQVVGMVGHAEIYHYLLSMKKSREKP